MVIEAGGKAPAVVFEAFAGGLETYFSTWGDARFTRGTGPLHTGSCVVAPDSGIGHGFAAEVHPSFRTDVDQRLGGSYVGEEFEAFDGSAVEASVDDTVEGAFTVGKAVAGAVDALKFFVSVVDVFALDLCTPSQVERPSGGTFFVLQVADVGVEEVTSVVLKGTDSADLGDVAERI